MSARVVSLALDAKGKRHSLAERVIALFQPLPDLRFTIILDGCDWWDLKEYGPENRGMFRIVNTEHVFDEPRWPFRLMEEIGHYDRATDKFCAACDAAIYLHDSTCTRPESLTMTLAHEVQHFMQYGSDRNVWALNDVVTMLPKDTIAKLGLRWCDIPIEREARVVAKRVCEELFGADATARYIEDRITNGTIRRDIDDWVFIQSIVTANEGGYQRAARTGRLYRAIEGSRGDLQETPNLMRAYSEYANLDLDDAFRLA